MKLQKNKKTSIYRTKHVLIEETRRVVCSITLLFKQNSTSALFKRKLLTNEFERMNEILLAYLYTVCCFNHIWSTFFYPSTLQNIFQWGMVMSNQLKIEKPLNSLSRNIEFDSSLYISIYRMNFVFSIVHMTVLHIWQAEKAPQRNNTKYSIFLPRLRILRPRPGINKLGNAIFASLDSLLLLSKSSSYNSLFNYTIWNIV